MCPARAPSARRRAAHRAACPRPPCDLPVAVDLPEDAETVAHSNPDPLRVERPLERVGDPALGTGDELNLHRFALSVQTELEEPADRGRQKVVAHRKQG
jgi:hypothetical protein